MRSKSVELKNQIYDYVNARKRETGSSPSLSEIGDQFGYNKSTIYRYLVEMNKDGMLFYDGNSIDTTEANESRVCMRTVPDTQRSNAGNANLKAR